MSAESPAAAPLVTVVIPAWGAAAYLGEALTSLQQQTRTGWQAVVVDDGDTDAVAAAFAPFAADRRFRLLQTDNGGPSAARNRGIAVADTPFVSLLDGDDRYAPDYVERMLAAFAADPGLDLVTCDVMMFGHPAFDGRLFSSLHPQRDPMTLERVIRREFNLSGGSMVRRELLVAVRGYDENLRASEDLDLWIRIFERNIRAARIDAPLIFYRRRTGSLSAGTLAMAQADHRVFSAAAARLAGRPETTAAREMVAKAERQLYLETGLIAILQGRKREGLRLLRRSDLAKRSLKWRLATIAFRLFPPLAGPVIRFYMRDHPFSASIRAGTS